ncbi:MAG: hypothetical protein ACREB6_08235, partial [Rhodospirillales bacterium]
SVPRLKLPTAAEETASPGARMGIYKPSGNGPFPALVLLHVCAAFFDNMAHWAVVAVKAGYVAFIVDSWGQRGLGDGICGPSQGVSPPTAPASPPTWRSTASATIPLLNT